MEKYGNIWYNIIDNTKLSFIIQVFNMRKIQWKLNGIK